MEIFTFGLNYLTDTVIYFLLNYVSHSLLELSGYILPDDPDRSSKLLKDLLGVDDDDPIRDSGWFEDFRICSPTGVTGAISGDDTSGCREVTFK